MFLHLFRFCRARLPPEKAPEPRAAKRASNELVLRAPRDPPRIPGGERFDVVSYSRSAIEAPDKSAHVVRKDVCSTAALPHETRIGQRPGVVLVPTFQVQLTRPATGRLE